MFISNKALQRLYLCIILWCIYLTLFGILNFKDPNTIGVFLRANEKHCLQGKNTAEGQILLTVLKSINHAIINLMTWFPFYVGYSFLFFHMNLNKSDQYHVLASTKHGKAG